MTSAAMESTTLVRELILDHIIKGMIVLVATVVLTLGIAVVWRTVGRSRRR
ncbi:MULTISPECIES: hypothetical protein [Streptomyces]|uniref:Uncharacterized protein n=1 Tax=Streptomyces morookaense TaxID=1970 RepID=A0A7Y7AZX1_STRMO|nr:MULTISPECIES: hypothetical protein [Streptomyces]MCC2276809.1 hypothetical protein [Streptomyces sp. ET3-23]NVK76254.1 hypothetical protein [Streptomyces morookaense]